MLIDELSSGSDVKFSWTCARDFALLSRQQAGRRKRMKSRKRESRRREDRKEERKEAAHASGAAFVVATF